MNKETEFIRDHLVRAYNKCRDGWRFDGKAFTTSWHVYSKHNYHCFNITREGDTYVFRTGISCVANEYLGNQILVASREFTDFTEGFIWLAENVAKTNELTKDLADRIQLNRASVMNTAATLQNI